MLGFSLRLTLSRFYSQVGFACRFAVGSEANFLPLFGIGRGASGTKLPIVASISLVLSS